MKDDPDDPMVEAGRDGSLWLPLSRAIRHAVRDNARQEVITPKAPRRPRPRTYAPRREQQ